MCVGYLRYYLALGILSFTDARGLEGKVHSIMSQRWKWSRQQAKQRMTLAPQLGGLGLKSLHEVIKNKVCATSRYLLTSDEDHVKQTKQIFQSLKRKRYDNSLDRGFKMCKLNTLDPETLPAKTQVSKDLWQSSLEQLSQKKIHSKFWKWEHGKTDNAWLEKEKLKMETVSIIMQA